jgi:hypothetical protein
MIVYSLSSQLSPIFRRPSMANGGTHKPPPKEGKKPSSTKGSGGKKK